MNTHRLKIRFIVERYFREIAFLGLSGVGHFFGILLSVRNSHLTTGITVGTFCVAPKFFSLLIVNMIPIVILASMLALSLKAWCYPFMLLYCVCRGFVGMFFYITFGSGAWLARFLTWFSSCSTAILMWWLLLRGISYPRTYLLKNTCISLIVILGVTVVDFWCIAPLLSSVIV